MCGKNCIENHVSTSTPFGLYINKEEGGGVCGLLGRGGVHMVTLYWGPVPLMGRASGANLRGSTSVYKYVMHVCVGMWLCAWCVVCVCECVRVCIEPKKKYISIQVNVMHV